MPPCLKCRPRVTDEDRMNETMSILDAQHVLNGEQIQAIRSAASASTSWDVSLRPDTPTKFQQRVVGARYAVERLEHELGRFPEKPSTTQPISGLLEFRSNPKVLRSAVAAVIPQPRDRDTLPRVLLGGHREEPRVATIAAAYLDAVKDDISAASLSLFVQEI